MTGVLVAASGCATSVRPTVAGVHVDHLQATLNATATGFRAWAASANVTVDPRGRCYVIPDEAAETLRVWCGPASWPGHVGGEFGRYTGVLGHQGGHPVLVVDTSRPPVQSTLAGVAALRAPDGHGVAVDLSSGPDPLFSLTHVVVISSTTRDVTADVTVALLLLGVAAVLVRRRRRQVRASPSSRAVLKRGAKQWAAVLAMLDAPAAPSTGHPIPTPGPLDVSSGAPDIEAPLQPTLPGLDHPAPGHIIHPADRAGLHPSDATHPTAAEPEHDPSPVGAPAPVDDLVAPVPLRPDPPSAPVSPAEDASGEMTVPPAEASPGEDASGGHDDDADEELTRIVAGPQIWVLGPVEIVAWPTAPRRRILVEIAAFLALHPARTWSSDNLRAELWPLGEDGSGIEVSEKTMRSYASYLRQALGADHFPLSTGVGYRLVDVATDWARFVELTELPSRDREAALTEALSMVRGAPFADAAAYTYGWAWGAEPLASEMEAAIVHAALELGQFALDVGDPARAAWAAGRALRAAPRDAALHELRIRAAIASRDKAEVDRAWTDAGAALGQGERELTLGELYRSLRAN
ncbi:MAG: AfsR/SARP family transcriptional regulator [Acidimicrobiales bacterium]